MKPSQLKLILVWLIVAVPLGWGVLKSVEKASPLFTPANAAGK